MAQFENVNYTFYSDTLGRAIVPDEKTFNRYKLENTLVMHQYIDDGLVCEKQLNGIDSAVCLWIEEDYKAEQAASGATVLESSESIGGYSHSVNTRAYDLQIEKNAKSTAQLKYKWLKLYCYINTGLA